jgi:hypothetical protein
VLPVDDEIQECHGQQNGKPIRQPEVIQHPPAFLLTDDRQTHSGYGKQESNQERIQSHNAEIARPPRQA